MPSSTKLVHYEPNAALAWLYRRFFDRIEVDAQWVACVREAETRGTVLYVLRNLSFVDFLALDYLTKRFDLPQVKFANDLGLSVLEPMGRGWLEALRARSPRSEAERLIEAVRSESSAALFLKRPPGLLDGDVPAKPRARGQIEGDALLGALLDEQTRRERPILLVPQVFVWSQRPDDAERGPIDLLFGPREWPGKVRTVAQFLTNFRHVVLRAGEPVDVAQFLETEARDASSEVLVRRLTYVLLRRLERERRSIVGPTKKAPDRLRDQVLRSPKLQKTISDMAGDGARERRVLTSRALSMLAELEASLDPTALKAMDATFDATIAKMYSHFDVDQEGLEALRRVGKDGTLVLLPSHKSHLDYIVLSRVFLQAQMPVPLIAAGDNLNFFPLGSVLRRGGAFFIRRSFKGDKLYGAVVDAYVRRLLMDGWPLEAFLEGGRSRTGKLLAPKTGLLSMLVDAALSTATRPVYFCPISIGYERIVEERSYARELGGAEKRKEDVRGLLGAAKLVAGRYGRLNVQFGEPLTLAQVLADIAPAEQPGEALHANLHGVPLSPPRRRAIVTRLAYRTMNEINRVTAVTASAIVSTVLLTATKRGVSHRELIDRCDQLLTVLDGYGARFADGVAEARDGGKRVRAVAALAALDLMVRAGHIEARLPGAPTKPRGRQKSAVGPDAIYVVRDGGRVALDFSKNLLVHFFVPKALVATCLLASGRADATEAAQLRERVLSLSRLFKHEFSFPADATFDETFQETLARMTLDGEIVRDEATVSVRDDQGGRERVEVHARMVQNFLEGYRVAARALGSAIRQPVTARDLAKRALAIGERMHLEGEIGAPEAIAQPLMENAFAAFVDLGYLRRTDGKVVVPESYASAEAVATIEARVAGFLPAPPSP